MGKNPYKALVTQNWKVILTLSFFFYFGCKMAENKTKTKKLLHERGIGKLKASRAKKGI